MRVNGLIASALLSSFIDHEFLKTVNHIKKNKKKNNLCTMCKYKVWIQHQKVINQTL